MSDNEDQVFNIFSPDEIKYNGHEYEACKDGIKYKSTDGKNWVQDCKNTEVHLTRCKPCEYIKAILHAYGAEHLIDLPESMRLLVLQSLEEIIVNE